MYEAAAERYDRERSRELIEKAYLDRVLDLLDERPRILDLGCGGGEPIARYLLDRGADVTGVDVAPALLAICRRRLPAMRLFRADMRRLDLGRTYEAVIAWDSFFHLDADDQRATFAVFRRHAAPGAALLLTTGHGAGIAIGDLGGQPLFHASLARDEYEILLNEHGFSVQSYTERDPDCGDHTVWLARRDSK